MKKNSSIDWFNAVEEDTLDNVKLDFAVSLERALNASGKSRTDLAAAIKVSPARITKIMRGDANLTIETMAKLSDAVGLELEIKLIKKARTINIGTVLSFANYATPKYRGAKEVTVHATENFNVCNDLEYANAA